MARKPPPAEPWERQPKETDPAWQGFKTYRDMGEDRSLAKVGRTLGKSKTLMETWSSNHKWRKRIDALESHKAKIEEHERQKAIRAQAQREIKAGIGMQALGQAQLQRYQPKRVTNEKGEEEIQITEKMSAFDARMCVVDGSKLVKSGMGEPESHTRVDVRGELTWSDLARQVRDDDEREAADKGDDGDG